MEYSERPEANDVLFKSQSGNNFNYATINALKGINNEHSLFLLIEGYRNASLKLINELLIVEKGDWLRIDSSIYPILFSFRHYLELILKDTIRNYNIIDNKISSDEIGFKKEHSILKLWLVLKSRIIEDYKEKEIYDLCAIENNSIEKMLNEINELDEKSFGFRYPFNTLSKDDKINSKISYIFEELKIDLNNLNVKMNKIINYFEGINTNSIVILDNIQTKK